MHFQTLKLIILSYSLSSSYLLNYYLQNKEFSLVIFASGINLGTWFQHQTTKKYLSFK